MIPADRATWGTTESIQKQNEEFLHDVLDKAASNPGGDPLRKKIGDILDTLAREEIDTEELLATGYRDTGKTRGKVAVPALGADRKPAKSRPAAELADLIQQLTERMHAAAAELQFEVAARLRYEVGELKKELRQMREAGIA